jgi:hypothetical protein
MPESTDALHRHAWLQESRKGLRQGIAVVGAQIYGSANQVGTFSAIDQEAMGDRPRVEQ